MPSQFPESMHVPLFPLPGVVLFPGSVLPLRVFEPRYRKLLADALSSHGLIAIAHLKDATDAEQPAVHSILGVGRIVAHEPQQDGTSNIALIGQARSRIEREIPNKPYRIANVVTLQDEEVVSPEEQQMVVIAREALMKVADALIGRTVDAEACKQLQRVLKERTEAGAVADLLASMYVHHSGLRQSLLETLNILERLRRVHAVMERLLLGLVPKPPPLRYSHNDYSNN